MGPRKNADLINKIGQELAEKYKIEFIKENFKNRTDSRKQLIWPKNTISIAKTTADAFFPKD